MTRCFPCLTLILSLCGWAHAEPLVEKGVIHQVFSGDHPDPTIVRDGEDFYLTYTSHDKYPGLKVWHSRNLTNWKPVSYALHQDVGLVWAPEFIKHEDLFYIYFPTSKGKNYVVTAKDPRGPWSDPVELKVNGIDPGHITDSDGNRFIYLNGGKFAHLAPDGLSVTKDAVVKYSGWPFPESWEVECFCLESPKLISKNGYYYLTSAQGGTAGPPTSHMAVAARARKPQGPWEESPYNPLVRTWSADERFWSKGHGTVFDDAEGNWYVIYHAYEKNKLAYGRHMLLETIDWDDKGWFRTTRNPMEEGKVISHRNESVESDRFEGDTIHLQWQHGGLQAPFDGFEQKDGALELRGSPDQLRTLQLNPFEHDYEVAAELGVEGDGMTAGVGIYYSDTHYVGIAYKGEHVILNFRDRVRRVGDVSHEQAKFLKVRLRGQVASFFYSANGSDWTKCSRSFELSGYQHNALGDYSYIRPVIYYQGEGKVRVRDFNYSPYEEE